MKTICRLFIGVVIASGGLFAQAPTVSAVYNPASYTPTGYPNSGIAEGSIFVAYGKNLGPVSLAQATVIPLPTTAGVGGTSVVVTVGGVSATAPMLYSLATQIAGVIPSNVPAGTGTLTVSFNGKSGSIPIQIVATNFGISTVNQTGGGPAVVTFANYSLVTTTTSAQPGNTLVLWGTGLGPISGSDAGVPNIVDLGTPVQVYVGGQPAAVTYRGRSGYPGLDQINFVVPSGLSGCYVSLVVQTGTTVSNNTTMAISPNGGPCSDANGIQLSSLAGPLSKGTVNIGTVDLTGISLALSVAGQTINTNNYSAVASFNRFTPAQIATSPSLFGTPSVGSCVVYTTTGTSAPSLAPVTAMGLDAGTAVTVNPPSGSALSLTEANGAKGTYTATPTSLGPGTYTISNGKGGLDVGAFSTTLTVAPQLTWTNQLALTTTTTGLPGTVNRAQPLVVTWSGGDPNGFAEIAGLSVNGTAGTSNGAFFLCIAPIAPGQFSVPPPVLLALPPTPSNGVGALLVGSTSAPQPFTATGLDFAFAAAGSVAGSSLLYQ